MRWSHLFIPTLRDNPAEAEVPSHQLLLRAGYVRQLASGLYTYLFLARRSLLKIEQIVRQEMDRMGAQEFYCPELHPAEIWQESGRWDAIGDDMFRLKDRAGRDMCLGMTEEEVMTWIARGELRSYKQLPQIWYQIQAKFRDEPRPKSGLMRVRRFTMKDSYSFDIDAAGLDVSYDKHHAAYCRIFDRCSLDYIPVEAHSGAMGGSKSHEFAAPSPAGEDLVAVCTQCDYAANLEKAQSVPTPVPDADGEDRPEEFATPEQKTIEEVAAFDGMPAAAHIKTLVMTDGEKRFAVLLRGDHQLSELKLEVVAEAGELRPAHPEEMEAWMGASAGSLGPVGLGSDIEIIADVALEGRKNLVAGANKDGFHLRNVTPGRDFEARYADIREVAEGDTCVRCGSALELQKCIEIGHIFQLGYRYSDSMGLRVLDENGKEVTPIMGSYGIGVERILTAAIEQNYDEAGMVLPSAIAPFEVVVTPVNLKVDEQKDTATKLYEQCLAAGLDVLLDDRKERAGVKFKDSELVGIPFRITCGKTLSEGNVELYDRSTRQSTVVRVEKVVSDVVAALRASSVPAELIEN